MGGECTEPQETSITKVATITEKPSQPESGNGGDVQGHILGKENKEIRQGVLTKEKGI